MNVSALNSSFSLYPSTPRDGRTSRATEAEAETSKSGAQAQGSQELSEEERQQVEKLKARDQEVRQHEMAHLAAAGGLALSGASYVYQRGPDGVNYAIGGEVSIDTSPGATPEETLRRAEQLQRAALAPHDPSGADRAIAAQAQQMAIEARAQLALERAQTRSASDPDHVGRAYRQTGETTSNTLHVYA
ncbi:putative metalloprotease CJM1_0395 family protein [Chitinimonas lacunae]|uniref:Metalloprotease CJM1_0395 family protein n=1 Tax=Chitinimonas lacunae TaxID=1963018 RepID=A0ABV8MLG9_9NEIS